jgi:hypothetical protein
MMKKLTFIAVSLLVGSSVYAQQGTDIYLFDFKIDKDQFSLSNARNITNSPGYDNQPYFLPNGESLLYASDDGFGQTDIYRYNLAARSERRMTFTPGSEYSPTITPDGEHFSCIILEKDGSQFLWQYPIQGAVAKKVSEISPIGYHVWINPNKLGAFLVGEPNTLKLIDLPSDNATQIANSPGATLAMVPGKPGIMSYVDISDDHSWKVKFLDTESKEATEVLATKKKGQYYAWTPNGILIGSDSKRLYKFDPSVDKDWVELANLSDYGIKDFTRLVISPTGDKLAIVVTE